MEKDLLRFQDETLTHAVIGAAMEVHSVLGPGLLESAYEDAFRYELSELGIAFERQLMVSMNYKRFESNEYFARTSW